MNVVDSNFNIIFPPLYNIREDIFKLEIELSEFFPKPFNLIPLPNEAPVEIPRITATSHHGFSSLNISLNSAQFSTNYSDDFSSNWPKCLSYILSHVKKIYSILKPRFNDRPSYCGLTVNFNYEVDDALSLLQKNFITATSTLKPYDLQLKQTFVIDERYYINFQIQNQRLYKNQMAQIGNMAACENHNLIGISLDVNDRYQFNYSPGYHSGADQIESVFSLTDRIVSNSLDRFVQEGVFKI